MQRAGSWSTAPVALIRTPTCTPRVAEAATATITIAPAATVTLGLALTLTLGLALTLTLGLVLTLTLGLALTLTLGLALTLTLRTQECGTRQQVEMELGSAAQAIGALEAKLLAEQELRAGAEANELRGSELCQLWERTVEQKEAAWGRKEEALNEALEAMQREKEVLQEALEKEQARVEHCSARVEACLSLEALALTSTFNTMVICDFHRP